MQITLTDAAFEMFDLLTTRRRSHSRLIEPGPDHDQLISILHAAMAAPDFGRLRPWRFTVFTGDDRAGFGDVLAEAARRRNPGISAAGLETERRRLTRAPVVISAGAHVVDGPITPEQQVAAVSAAVQNMLLAATALGFGSIWRTGPVCYDPTVKQALDLGEQDRLVGFVYLGTAATITLPSRQPAEDSLVRWGWPEPVRGR